MQEELLQLKNDALSLILETDSLTTLEKIYIQFLGKSGKLTALLKKLPTLSPEEKPLIGRTANEVKTILQDTIESQKLKIKSQKLKNKQDSIDTTIPGIKPKIGHLHPLTQVLSDVIDIFKGIGFQTADGPEIETDYYNFEALNIPKDHPSRDTQQTLYLDTRGNKLNPGEIILRTQTSAMQGRVMEKTTPPIRVIVPGKNFRYEQVDASHGFEFWQVEGFCVDKHIRLTDLFGTIEYILKKIMGEKTKLKFAVTNFPFVEPGVDTYIECTMCKGKGCSFCKMSGWSEIMPAGMIHPNVLKAAGYDSQKVSGFAFAIGLSRLVTLKYQMDDLRLLTNPDLRIINQF